MPTQKLILSALLIAGMLVTGCQLWNPGGSTYVDKKGKFNVHTPMGWKYATSLGSDLIASKDGPILQQISIEHRELETALPKSKRPLAANLGVFELAEAVAGDMQADNTLLGFELKENVPATIGGTAGFKITFTFTTAEKLRLAQTVYGCIFEGQLWLLRYSAPVRHYFERDLATFEDTVKSFKFGKS
jgi:hypothetical protein